MKKRYWILLGIFILIVATYFLGPKQPVPVYNEILPTLPKDLQALETYIEQRELSYPVRKDNQARIIWQHDSPEITEYSIVYLHGFAGSWRDGYPVNIQVADTLDANIYLARWAGHGLIPPASLDSFNPEAAWESAKEALVIGKKIGKKVIIISTSTGGTLAIKLAAAYPESIFALINLSPNIEDDVDGAFILNSPWGYEISQLLVGDDKEIEHEEELAVQYWDTVYPSSALVDLQVLVSTTMTKETFKKIKIPVITLFYYENFIEEDNHVEVEVYPEVHNTFSTPGSLQKLVQLSTPKTHFIGSDIKSQDTEIVLKEIIEFLTTTLNIEI